MSDTKLNGKGPEHKSGPSLKGQSEQVVRLLRCDNQTVV